MEFEFPQEGEALLYECNVAALEYRTPTARFFRDGRICYRHKGYDYGFEAAAGRIVPGEGDAFLLTAEGRKLVLRPFA